MRIPARALKPLVAMAIAAASFGCIAPAAYAENATAAVISDDGDHVVVDVDLSGSAPVGDATEQADMKSSQGESVSDAEPDEALKAFEALMTANDIIIRSAFYYILLPSLFAMALPLLLYELLELHDRRRLGVPTVGLNRCRADREPGPRSTKLSIIGRLCPSHP